MNFKKLKITEGKYWDAFLHEDQTVIGRIYFWYKEEGIIDLLDAPEEAILEFQNLAKKFKNSLINLFKPDMFNYLALNNNTQHLHIHMIPRYSKKVRQFGFVFKDSNFGKNYKRDLNFKIDEEVLIKIKEEIKKQLG